MPGRRPLTLILLAAAAPILVWVPVPTGAIPRAATDPDDVALRLDLKSVFHADDVSSITYTVETHESFPDDAAGFKWGIDTNEDEDFDVLVFVEWDGTELVAGVEDAAGNWIADARVSRPSGEAITVVFPVAVLGDVASYRYGVSAGGDLNGNGQTDAGELDVAPDSGLYDHKLETAARGSAGGRATSVAAPVAGPSAPPAPRPVQPPAPAPAVVASEQKAAAASGQPVAQGSTPSAAPSVERPAALARTGGGAVLLGLLAGVALITGGFMFIAESFIPRVKPRAWRTRWKGRGGPHVP